MLPRLASNSQSSCLSLLNSWNHRHFPPHVGSKGDFPCCWLCWHPSYSKAQRRLKWHQLGMNMTSRGCQSVKRSCPVTLWALLPSHSEGGTWAAGLLGVLAKDFTFWTQLPQL
jgi:hypothetical protein